VTTNQPYSAWGTYLINLKNTRNLNWDALAKQMHVSTPTLRASLYLNPPTNVETVKKFAGFVSMHVETVYQMMGVPSIGPITHVGEAPATYHPDEYIWVPFIDIPASAGSGTIADNSAFRKPEPFKKIWITEVLKANPQNLHFMYVEGDSMEPTLLNGEMILIDTNAQVRKHLRDQVYVVRSNGNIFVKRIQISFDKTIKLISDNPRHLPETIDLSDQSQDFEVLGRVLWTGRKL
jgi:hypothetical protein